MVPRLRTISLVTRKPFTNLFMVHAQKTGQGRGGGVSVEDSEAYEEDIGIIHMYCVERDIVYFENAGELGTK